MKQSIFIIILLSLFILSCNEKSNKKYPKQEFIEQAKESKVKLNQLRSDSISKVLSRTLSKAAQALPADSAALYEFYYKMFKANDNAKKQKQINRIETLISEKSLHRYHQVEKNLVPLLTRIVREKHVDKSQIDSVVVLYSDYDHFSGSSLFSQLLSEEENYSLVWESFRIISNESKGDTACIAALINLDKVVRTNVELAEAMQDFIVKSIYNNSEGFLDMYLARSKKDQIDFSNYICIWDDPSKEIISKLKIIVKESKNENYREAAKEILDRYKFE